MFGAIPFGQAIFSYSFSEFTGLVWTNECKKSSIWVNTPPNVLIAIPCSE